MQQVLRRKNKRRYFLIPIVLLFIAALEAALFYYFHIYLKQINSINNISLKVKQNSSYNLPKRVEAKLRNNEYEMVPVKWNKEKVNTNKTGTLTFIGTVEGYEKEVSLKINVFEYIQAVDKPSNVVVVSSDSERKKDSFNLPKTLSVTYSSGKSGTERVKWDTSKINMTEPGNYTAVGSVVSLYKCEPSIVCSVQVIDEKEVLRRVLIDNEFTKEDYVKESLGKIEELPSTVLQELLDWKMTIEFVSEDISDRPEFSSLKEQESDTLKIFGVFKYPMIVIDCQAQEISMFNDVNNFNTLTLHEVGHSFDYLSGNTEKDNYRFDLSSGEDFNLIWQEEAEKIFNPDVTSMAQDLNDYYTQSPIEYFAECFAFYFSNETSKQMLRDNAPRTYEFIEEHVNE